MPRLTKSENPIAVPDRPFGWHDVAPSNVFQIANVPSRRCARPLNNLGHHRTACARAGFSGVRIKECRCSHLQGAGGKMVANAMLRDFDLIDPDPEDKIRIEILAHGLPRPTGGGHHRRVCFALRLFCARPGLPRGWSSLGCGQAQEGENLPRAGQPSRKKPVILRKKGRTGVEIEVGRARLGRFVF